LGAQWGHGDFDLALALQPGMVGQHLADDAQVLGEDRGLVFLGVVPPLGHQRG
jgi:hypothetical protein